MGSTILVTGATGKTGRRLIPLLVERGATVRAASRTAGPAGAGVEPVPFDWLDQRTHQVALAGVDAVYLVSAHLSGHTADPSGAVGAFLAGIGPDVRRLVLLSSFGVDQAPPDDPLRRTELLVEAARVPATILRPTAFMQNFSESHWAGLHASIRDHGRIAMPGGTARVSYVSTQDIAAVAAHALTEDGHDGRAYALTGPEPLTLTEVAQHISAATARQVTYVETGPGPLRDNLVAAGASEHFADYATQLFLSAVTTNAMATVTGDITTVTGRPATTFAHYAAAAAPAWRQ
ncbi:MAG TPA: NAD(P)H-binding protein [Actinophytocola sp.]|uniref:NAD(P)H-binding protein n=1 Tax=Actinophytocola sp. TaxID=1872138 RepID=UPI002DBC0F12|nr:NAD(P)H-binding protein [Actinophytocola sp.]HEU5475188.1 NAD(P)H-binding protein [Actinophytocola sp.]